MISYYELTFQQGILKCEQTKLFENFWILKKKYISNRRQKRKSQISNELFLYREHTHQPNRSHILSDTPKHVNPILIAREAIPPKHTAVKIKLYITTNDFYVRCGDRYRCSTTGMRLNDTKRSEPIMKMRFKLSIFISYFPHANVIERKTFSLKNATISVWFY